MKIKPFQVEEWMNAYEVGAKYNIAETCVDSISLNDLFALSGVDKALFLEEFCARRLTYGDIEGALPFRQGVSKLYKTIQPDQVITTHGASGANHHIFYSLINPSDHIISIMPTYQQLYSIPESLGAEVSMLHLNNENNFLPDMKELRRLVTSETKMICINNPNNPTGSLMTSEILMEIVEIARSADAYILCDEVYRHLTQGEQWCESIADIYEKGISVSSMSKVFSLAGIRQGWIASRDENVIKSCLSHRDYNLISCGMFDEAAGALALTHSHKILERNQGIVRENLNILDEWVQKEPELYYIRPQAGTTALVFYHFDIPSYDFCERLYHATGAFVTPGDCFEQ
ncbi:MAG: aminotransferase, partial [Lacrimispora sphenoides]